MKKYLSNLIIERTKNFYWIHKESKKVKNNIKNEPNKNELIRIVMK